MGYAVEKEPLSQVPPNLAYEPVLGPGLLVPNGIDLATRFRSNFPFEMRVTKNTALLYRQAAVPLTEYGEAKMWVGRNGGW